MHPCIKCLEGMQEVECKGCVTKADRQQLKLRPINPGELLALFDETMNKPQRWKKLADAINKHFGVE